MDVGGAMDDLLAAYREHSEALTRKGSSSRASAQALADSLRDAVTAGSSIDEAALVTGMDIETVNDVLNNHPCPSCTYMVGRAAPLCLQRHEGHALVIAALSSTGAALNAAEKDMLAELASVSATANGPRPEWSMRRLASARLTTLVDHLHTTRRVKWQDLASATGLSVAALRQRVSRHSGL
jgi:hypothetical protein